METKDFISEREQRRHKHDPYNTRGGYASLNQNYRSAMREYFLLETG